MIGNILTNQLNFVSQEEKKGIPFIERALIPQPGYHQVVYRKGVYTGRLQAGTTANHGVKAQRGDDIFSVTDTPQPYALVGTIRTKDKFRRIYEIPLDVQVADPRRVVEVYVRQHDPAKLAIDAFKEKFEYYASRYTHAQLLVLHQGLPLKEWNISIIAMTGFAIQQSGKALFREDPDFTELATIEQATEKQRREIQAKYEIEAIEKEFQRTQENIQNDHRRREKEKQNDFQRQENTKEHINQICKQFRDVAVKELTAVLQERIREGFDSGRPISEIGGEYLSLFELFDDPFHVQVEQDMYKGQFVDGSTAPDPVESQEQATDAHQNIVSADH